MTAEPQPQSRNPKGDAEGHLALRWPVSIMLTMLIAYLVYNLFYPTFTWGQKTTVTVSTPDGLRSGSSVVEVSWWATPSILPDAPDTLYDITGEAVVVDLGNGRYLFALLNRAESVGLEIFGGAEHPTLSRPRGTLLEMARRVVARTGEARDLPRKHYPLLVTFGDINDPTSLRRVNPGDLAASFGPGYGLNEITLSITDEPITRGKVEKAIGWLVAIGRERPTLIPNPPLLRKNATDPAIQYLTPGPFSTELYR